MPGTLCAVLNAGYRWSPPNPTVSGYSFYGANCTDEDSMKNNLTIKVLTLILLTISGVSIYRVVSFGIHMHKTAHIVEKLQTQRIIENKEETTVFTRDSWNDLEGVNEDFIGYIVFSDGWIEEPIVQGSDNLFYLTHDLNKAWNEFGTVYMDANSRVDDQNITVYGHNVFMGGDLMFTPLGRLVDQEVFDEHHSFRIYWKDDYREYEITHVFYWDEVNNRNFDYKQSSFPIKNEFDEYKQWIDSHNLITSEESLNDDSSFVSLQTCKDLSSSIRIVVIAKEISRSSYM